MTFLSMFPLLEEYVLFVLKRIFVFDENYFP